MSTGPIATAASDDASAAASAAVSADERHPATPRSAGRPRAGSGSVSRGSIGEAALRILAEQGSAGLSVSAVAKRLGVRSQSLYYHVRDLTDIVDAARSLLVSRIDLAALDPEQDFLAGVQEYAESYYQAFLPVSRSIWLFFEHPIHDARTIDMYERFMRRALAAGLDQDAALALMLDIEYAVLLVVFEHASLKAVLPEEALSKAEALRSALARMSPDTPEGSRARLAVRVRDLVGQALSRS